MVIVKRFWFLKERSSINFVRKYRNIGDKLSRNKKGRHSMYKRFDCYLIWACGERMPRIMSYTGYQTSAVIRYKTPDFGVD